MESCENCGRSIGRLESACLHGNHVVCAECKVKLSSDHEIGVRQTARSEPLEYQATPQRGVSIAEDRVDFGECFVESHLSSTEQIVVRSGLHWVVFVKPVAAFAVIAIIALALMGASARAIRPQPPGAVYLLPFILILVGLLVILHTVVLYISTEYAVTNRRVLVKRGYLSRRTVETLLAKIESVKLEQGMLDRLFGSGTIITVGTGGTHEPLYCLRNPMAFRRRIEEAIARIDAQR